MQRICRCFTTPSSGGDSGHRGRSGLSRFAFRTGRYLPAAYPNSSGCRPRRPATRP